MKKTLLVLFAAASLALCVSSCGDPKTTAEMLTGQTKGWVLSSATSNPAYELSSGRSVENLMDGYFYECEMDDIITFQENGVQLINPGKKIDAEWGYQAETYASWALSENDTKLTMQLPFFLDDTHFTFDLEPEVCTIASITSNQLVLEYKFNDNESPAKGEYTFTLTYVPAK